MEQGAEAPSEAAQVGIPMDMVETIAQRVVAQISEKVIRELAWEGRPGSAAVLLASVPAAKDAQLWAWVLEPGDRYDAEPDPEGWSELLIVS